MASSFLERLKFLQAQWLGGQSASAFARAVGVKVPTYHTYLKGTDPPREVVSNIIEKTGCSADWLLTGRGDMFASPASGDKPLLVAEAKATSSKVTLREHMISTLKQATHMVEKYCEAFDNSDQPPRIVIAADQTGAELNKEAAQLMPVPILSGRTAAESPRNVLEQEIDGWAFCYRSHVRHPATTSALRVTGESMEPLIADGDLVGVDYSIRTPDQALQGKWPLVVVRDDTCEGVAARVAEHLDDVIVFRPYNMIGEFPRFIWHLDRDEPNPICGRVMWTYRACC